MAKGIDQKTEDLGKDALLFLQEWAQNNEWQIDGSPRQEVTEQGLQCVPGDPGDVGVYEPSEILNTAFTHYAEYTQTLQNKPQDPFKKIGLDLSWLKVDSNGQDLFQVSLEFSKKINASLQPRLSALAFEFSSKLALPMSDLEVHTEVLKYAWEHTELKLLPFAEQKDLLDNYIVSLSLTPEATQALRKSLPTELGRLRLGLSLPKVVAQKAVLEAQRLLAQAETERRKADRSNNLFTRSAKQKNNEQADRYQKIAGRHLSGAEDKFKRAGVLLRTALQLDSNHAVASLELARWNYTQKNPDLVEVAHALLVSAIRKETSLFGQQEIVRGIAQSGPLELGDPWTFFDQIMNLQDRRDELPKLHLVMARAEGAQDPELEFQHLKKAYEAGDKQSSTLERLAALYHERGDFDSAFQTAKERYSQAFRDKSNFILRTTTEDQEYYNRAFTDESAATEFEVALARYAMDAGDPVLANEALSTRYGNADPRDRRKNSIMLELHNNPALWIEAAKKQMQEGEYAKAEETLNWAKKVNEEGLYQLPFYANDGSAFDALLKEAELHQKHLEEELPQIALEEKTAWAKAEVESKYDKGVNGHVQRAVDFVGADPVKLLMRKTEWHGPKEAAARADLESFKLELSNWKNLKDKLSADQGLKTLETLEALEQASNKFAKSRGLGMATLTSGRLSRWRLNQVEEKLEKGEILPNGRVLDTEVAQGNRDQILAMKKEIQDLKNFSSQSVAAKIDDLKKELETAVDFRREELTVEIQNLEIIDNAVQTLSYYQIGIKDLPDFKKFESANAAFKERLAKEPEKISSEDQKKLSQDFEQFELWFDKHSEFREDLLPAVNALKTVAANMLVQLNSGDFKAAAKSAAVISALIESLKAPGLKHTALNELLEDTRVKFASAVSHQDDQMKWQAFQDLKVIQEYVELGKKKEAWYAKFASLYPSQSKLILRLSFDPTDTQVKEYARYNPYTLNASMDALWNSPAPKYYRDLQQSDPNSPLLAHMEAVFGDLQNSLAQRRLSDANLTDIGYDENFKPYYKTGERYQLDEHADRISETGVRDPNRLLSGGYLSLADLKKQNATLRQLYGGNENQQIFDAIQNADTQERLKKVSGARERQELEDSLKVLESYSGVPVALQSGIQDPGGKIESNQDVSLVVDHFLQRGEAYAESLKSEIRDLELQESWGKMAWWRDEALPERKAELQEKLSDFEAEFTRQKAILEAVSQMPLENAKETLHACWESFFKDCALSPSQVQEAVSIFSKSGEDYQKHLENRVKLLAGKSASSHLVSLQEMIEDSKKSLEETKAKYGDRSLPEIVLSGDLTPHPLQIIDSSKKFFENFRYSDEGRLRYVSSAERQAEADLQEFKAGFELAKSVMDSLRDEPASKALPQLQAFAEAFQNCEEANLKFLIEDQIDKVDGIYKSSHDKLDVDNLKNTLTSIFNQKEVPLLLKVEAYKTFMLALDGKAVSRSVKARISQLENMRNEVETADDVTSFVTGVSINSEMDFIAMKKNYVRILEMLESGDMAKIAEGRMRFGELDSAGLHKTLQEIYQTSAELNQYTVGILVITLSAGIGAAVAAGVGLMVASTLARGFAMAAGFTISSRVLHGAFYDGWSGVGNAFEKMAEDPFGLAEEIMLNWAMFGVINKTGSIFLKFYGSRLEAAAVRSLISKGILQEGVEVSQSFLAKNPAIQEALQMEIHSLQQSIPSMALQHSGAFAVEALTFQGWEGMVAQYQMIKAGTWSPEAAAGAIKHAFLPENIMKGARFLLALKAGGVFTMPLTKMMEHKFEALQQSRFDKTRSEFDLLVKEAEGLAVRYFEMGVGDHRALLDLYMKAADKQRELIEQVPKEMRNPDVEFANQALRRKLAEFAEGAPSWDAIFNLQSPFGVRVNESLPELKGALVLEFSGDKAADLVTALAHHPWVLGVGVSPSGNGVLRVTYRIPTSGAIHEFFMISREQLTTWERNKIAKLQAEESADEMMNKLETLEGPIEGEGVAGVSGSASSQASTRVGKAPKPAPETSDVAAHPAQVLTTGEVPVVESQDRSIYTGVLEGKGGAESYPIDFSQGVFHRVRIGNTTLLIQEAKGSHGETIYQLAVSGQAGQVLLRQREGGPAQKVSQRRLDGKTAFKYRLKEGMIIEVGGKKLVFHPPEVSAREKQAREAAEQAEARMARDAAELAGGTLTPTSELGTQAEIRPGGMDAVEVAGVVVKKGEGILHGFGKPLVYDPQLRTMHVLPSQNGKVLFNAVKNPETGKMEYSLTYWGEQGGVQVQAQGKGPLAAVESSGKYGEKSPHRHPLKDQDVIVIDGEPKVFRTPEGIEVEGRRRDFIAKENAKLTAEREKISQENDPQIRSHLERELQAKEEAFAKMLETEQRTLDGVPYKDLMPPLVQGLAKAVFDGKVDLSDGKATARAELYDANGKVDPAVRRALHQHMIETMSAQGMKLSSDNAKAVDSMIDLALSAKNHGIIDRPGGLTEGQFMRLVAELYLHNSPLVRISGPELTHVPMVVEATLGFLETQNPDATVGEKRVAFVTALFHDAGKWDPQIVTEKGYSIKPHPVFNPTGKTIEVEPGKSLRETLDRYRRTGVLTPEQVAQVKMPPSLIATVVHHDASAVRQQLKQLESEGILQKGEADAAWQAIVRHGLVSSWVLNNSGLEISGVAPASRQRDLGIHSDAFSDPAYAKYIELYYELTNRLLEGQKIDLSAQTSDPQVLQLREIFAKEFSPLDRAMMLGDHQGQIDVGKYLGILSLSPANQQASVWQLIFSGDRANSLLGVLKTHADEQALLQPQIAQLSGEAFKKAEAWLQQTDPQQPGLAQALMQDPAAFQRFSEWADAHPAEPRQIEAWLKAESVLGPDGKPSPTLTLIQQAVERAFYQRFFVDRQDSLSPWENVGPTWKGLPKWLDGFLGGVDLSLMSQGAVPYGERIVSPETARRISVAVELAREFELDLNDPYRQSIENAVISSSLDPAEASRIFKAFDEGLNGVTDFAAYGISRQEIFLDILAGRISLEYARQKADAILKGEVRVTLTKDSGPSKSVYQLEPVPAAERSDAMIDAHVQRAMATTGRDSFFEKTPWIRPALVDAIKKGEIDLFDLERAAGIGLSPEQIRAREDALGVTANHWMEALAKDPQGFMEKIGGRNPEIDVPPGLLGSVDPNPTGKQSVVASAIAVGLAVLFTPDMAHAAASQVSSTGGTSPVVVAATAALVTGIVGVFRNWLGKTQKVAPLDPAPAPTAVPDPSLPAAASIPTTRAPQTMPPVQPAARPPQILPTRPTDFPRQPGQVSTPVQRVAMAGEEVVNRPAEPGVPSLSARTHPGAGKKAASQEDGFVVGKDYAFVIDAMGGHEKGEWATAVGKDAIQQSMEGQGDPVQALLDANTVINKKIPTLGLSAQALKDSAPGAVAVGYKIIRNPDGSREAEIVHVGDSGALVLGLDANGQWVVKHRTRDQSYVEYLLNNNQDIVLGGEFAPTQPHSPEVELQMRSNEHSNATIGTIGADKSDNTHPVRTRVPLGKGDVIVLFSDGICDNLTTAEIIAIVKNSKTAEEAQEAIFQAAYEKMNQLTEVNEEFSYHAKKAKSDPNYTPPERIPFTGLDGQQLWIDRKYRVYDARDGGNLVDQLKLDNLTVLVHKEDALPVSRQTTLVGLPPIPFSRAQDPGMAIAAQPAEPAMNVPVPLDPGRYPITAGSLPASKLPSAFDIYVGASNVSSAGQGSMMILHEMMGQRTPALWVGLTRSGNGYLLENKRPDGGAIPITVQGTRRLLAAGDAVQLGRDDTFGVGLLSEFKVGENGNLELGNPMGAQIAGEIVVP